MSALVLCGAQAVTVTQDPGAIAERDKLIARSKLVETITNQAQYESCREAVRSLKKWRAGVESDRVAVKAEPLRVTREIDALAGAVTKPAQTEEIRAHALAEAWAIEQERIREEAARKAKAEADRLAKEAADKLAAEQRAIRDEQARKQKEIDDAALAAAKAAVTPEQARKARMDKLKAEMDAEQEAEAAEARAKVAAANRATEAVQKTAWVPAVKSALKTVPQWKVVNTPEFLEAHPGAAAGLQLAISNPELVNIVPKVREIEAQLRAGVRKIDGLEIWEEKELRR